MEQNNLTNENLAKELKPLENKGEQISDLEKSDNNIERDLHDVEVEVREYARTYSGKIKDLQAQGLSFEEANKLMYDEWIKNDPGGQNYIRILNLYKDQIKSDEEIKQENKKKIDILNQELVKNKEEETELKNRLEKENLTEEEYLETKSKLEKNLAQSLKLEDELVHADYVAPWETRVRQKMQEMEKEEKTLSSKISSTTEAINQINENLGLPPKKVTEIPSLNKIQEKFLNTKIIKALLFTGLMFTAKEGLSQNKSEKDTEKEHKEWVEKQYKLYKKGALKEGDHIKSPDGGIYKIGSLDAKSSKKDNSLEGGDQKTSLNISQFFKTGTTEFINSQAEQNAKESLRDFLQNVDLKNFKINVLGTYSIDRAYDRNQELAEARRDLGYKILLEVLKEKYSQEEINKIVIEAQAKGKSLLDSFTQEKIDEMSRGEKEKAIDANQGISFKLESINKKREVKELVFQKTFNNIEDFNNVAAVIVDNSNSMREDIAQVSDFIQKINLENKKLNKESIGIFTVEGKDKEAHLNTLMSVLNKMQKNENRKEIVLMTDEPDNALDKTEYYQKIKQILDLSQEKNINIILKVLNSVGGEAYKVIELNEKNKDVLLSQHKDEATWYASLNDTP
jgi:hypothetical protein